MTDKETLLRKELKNNLSVLDRALDTFNYSCNKCRRIGIKDHYSYAELDGFEALTARFVRVSDILTQRVLRSVFLLLREDVKTFIDRINKAEQLEIIPSAEELKTIRDLRNEIAHEYCMDDIAEIFENVLNYSGVLLTLIDSTKRYIETKRLTITPPNRPG